MGLQQARSLFILLFYRSSRVVALQSTQGVSHDALHEIFIDDRIEETAKEGDVRTNQTQPI